MSGRRRWNAGPDWDERMVAKGVARQAGELAIALWPTTRPTLASTGQSCVADAGMRAGPESAIAPVAERSSAVIAGYTSAVGEAIIRSAAIGC